MLLGSSSAASAAIGDMTKYGAVSVKARGAATKVRAGGGDSIGSVTGAVRGRSLVPEFFLYPTCHLLAPRFRKKERERATKVGQRVGIGIRIQASSV